jgi:hypothetical protein
MKGYLMVCSLKWLQRLAPVMVLAMPLVGFGASEKASLVSPQVLPGGGVADPDGKVGYFPNTTGGIDTLDLASGKLLWSTQDANRPLLATNDRLYARAQVKDAANQVRVVVLDAKQKGKRLLESKSVVFPGWVSVGVAYGRSFAATARLADGSLLLAWEARGWYSGGARPTPEVERAARKEASGVARIDLRSGQVEHVANEKIPKDMPPRVPGELRTAKVGDRVFAITDKSAANPRQPFQRQRLLRAVDASGKVLWERAIAAPVFLPPRP